MLKYEIRKSWAEESCTIKYYMCQHKYELYAFLVKPDDITELIRYCKAVKSRNKNKNYPIMELYKHSIESYFSKFKTQSIEWHKYVKNNLDFINAVFKFNNVGGEGVQENTSVKHWWFIDIVPYNPNPKFKIIKV